MRKLKRSVERNQRAKKAAKVAMMTMMAASLAFSDVAVVSTYAEAVYTLPINGTTIDISKCSIDADTNKILVNIDTDGTYTLTGENLYNGAYVDVSIVIAGGVVADLYLDNLHIVNDDFEYTGGNTNMMSAVGDVVNPIVVNGTANVYIKRDSEIKAVADFFTVNGTLKFVESEANAKLSCSVSRIMRRTNETGTYTLGEPLVFRGSGNVHFGTANVSISNTTGTDDKYGTLYFSSNYGNSAKVYIEGSGLLLTDVYSPKTVYTDLLSLEGININPTSVYSLEGVEMTSILPTSLPANSEIIQMDICEEDEWGDMGPVIKIKKNLNVSTDGNLSNILLPAPSYLYLRDTSGNVYAYRIDEWSESAISVTDDRLVTINYIDNETQAPFATYYSVKNTENKKGATLLFPKEESNYDYNYKLEDGTEVANHSIVYGNMNIYVTKTPKAKVSVTVDGNLMTLDCGAQLSAYGGISGYYQDEESGALYTADTEITASCSLVKVNLSTVTEAGKEWFVIDSAGAMKTFAEVVNRGAANINGRLTQDITLGSDYPMAGSFSDTNGYFEGDATYKGYAGTFDGQNHTVTLTVSSTAQTAGLFSCLSAGAVIQNVITKGSISGGDYSGAIAGVAYGKQGTVTVRNCINYATVSGSSSEGSCAGGLVGCEIVKSNEEYSHISINFICCGNNGEISANSYCGGLLGSSGSSRFYITNCYNSHDSNIVGRVPGNSWQVNGCYSIKADNFGTAKSAEAFSSGEVTYLLSLQRSNTWFQNLETDSAPVFSGHVVYAGYSDCETTTLSYSNSDTALHPAQGHKAASDVSYNDGTLSVKCEYCQSDIYTATLNIPDAASYQSEIEHSVSYTEAWENAGCPHVNFAYLVTPEGGSSEYVVEFPTEEGDYEVKASIGGMVLEEKTVHITPQTGNDPYGGTDPNGGNTNPEGNPQNTEHVPSPEERANQKLREEYDTAIDQMKVIAESIANRIGNGETTSNEEENVIYFSSGDSLPGYMLRSLQKYDGVVLDFTCTYEGKEYHFRITGGDSLLLDESVEWYGPLYLTKLFGNLADGTPAAVGGQTYTVVPGDSLNAIAERFGITVDDILKKNPEIKNANQIYVGQTINL